MNTALEYNTRVVQEAGRRCKKSTLNDLVDLTPLRIPLMNPPYAASGLFTRAHTFCKMNLILRYIGRRPQMLFSMARKFKFRQLRRYSMHPILPKFTLPPNGNLRIYYVFLDKLNFS
jgi:hypothetical protein